MTHAQAVDAPPSAAFRAGIARLMGPGHGTLPADELAGVVLAIDAYLDEVAARPRGSALPVGSASPSGAGR